MVFVATTSLVLTFIASTAFAATDILNCEPLLLTFHQFAANHAIQLILNIVRPETTQEPL